MKRKLLFLLGSALLYFIWVLEGPFNGGTSRVELSTPVSAELPRVDADSLNFDVGAQGGLTVDPVPRGVREGEERRVIVAYQLEGVAFGVPIRGESTTEGKKGLSQVFRYDFQTLARLRVGDTVEMPLPAGGKEMGEVLGIQYGKDGRIHVGGKRKEGLGGFLLEFNSESIRGHLLLEDKHLAYTFEGDRDSGGLRRNWVVQRKIGEVICESIPWAYSDTAQIAAPDAAEADTADFESFPEAEAVAYIDFDGGVVTDVAWTRFNGGNAIDAKPQDRTTAEKLQIARWVAEDFYPFCINVTTKRSVYDAAPKAKRMRCIVTSTNFRGSGGVAYLNSFGETDASGAGKVCWAFNSGIQVCATTVSHEIGHTFGLGHDGRSVAKETYFYGFAGAPVSWGPIMGASFYIQMDQWSKGEYGDANNAQDDLAVISAPSWAVGLRVDDAGDTRDKAVPLTFQSELIYQSGGITTSADIDYYVFSSLGGDFNATVSPASQGPNLDIQIQLEDSAGRVVSSSAPQDVLSASVNAFLQPGVYYLRVANSGNRDPKKDGYSTYGSLGSYLITGSMRTMSAVPVVTSSATQDGVVGTNFLYRISATNSPTVYAVSGVLPLGLTFSSLTGEISGKPQAVGNFTVTIFAGNDAGTGSKSLTIRLVPSPKSLAQAVNQPAFSMGTFGKAPWFVDSVYASDGVASAASGRIEHGESSSMVTAIPGPTQVSFKWACSSEVGDRLKLFINDVENAAWISGERSWTTLSVDLPGKSNKVEWRYVKDSNLSSGADTAWVDALQIGAVPRVTAEQGDVNVLEGASVQLRFESFGATSYQWLKNGQAFTGKVTNRTVAGGRVETVLDLGKVKTADEGQYTVQISNALGSVNRTVQLFVEGPLAIVQSPQNTVISEGRSGALYVRISGGSRLSPPKVEWLFNGLPLVSGIQASAAKWGVADSAYTLKDFSDSSNTGLYVLSLDPAYLFEEGEYSVRISSNASSLLSAKARVRVAPVLSVPPSLKSVSLGGSFSFSLATPTTLRGSGQFPLIIQWMKDKRPLAGKNLPTLKLTNVQAVDGGTYSVQISSAIGGTPYTLDVGRLQVGVKPKISRQPASVSTWAGKLVQFSVTINGGSPPIQAQWFKDGQPLQGGTGLTLAIQSAETTDAGEYFVRLSNSGGIVQSNSVRLTVQAVSLNEVMSQGPMLKGQPFRFVWCPDFGGWAGVAEVSQAQYAAVMKANPSAFAGLDRPVESVTWSEAISFCNTLTTLARADGWLPKSWEFTLPLDSEWTAIAGGSAVAGEIFGRSEFQGTAPATSGSMNARGVYGSYGNVAEWGRSSSMGARSVLGGAWDYGSLQGIWTPASRWSEGSRSPRVGFRIYLLYAPQMDPLVIVSQPRSQSVKQAAPVTFAISVKGGRPPYKYQWRRDGLDLPGANDATLKLSAASMNDAGDYQVLVSASGSWVLSGTASLNVTNAGPPQALQSFMNKQPVFDGTQINFAWVPSLNGWFGLTEVSQSQFQNIQKYNPSTYIAPDKPVENISWYEANALCERLNSIGRAAKWLPAEWAFTLPSEAEYAYFLPRVASASAVLGRSVTEGPAKVGSLAASPDGLFDVRGNVREWCRNWSDASKVFKVQVGGSCLDFSGADQRVVQLPSVRQSLSGFRVALVKIGADAGVPPSITRIPKSLKVNLGAAASFVGAATGTAPLAVQWFKDGIAIPGATAFTLSIPKVATASAGNYSFQVTNSAGVARSAAASLIVQSAASVDSLFLRLAKPTGIGPTTFDFGRVDAIKGWAMRSEVSQDQFRRVMGKNPSLSKDADLPVHNLTWEDASAFCDRLNTAARDDGWLPAGWMFSLPSETEWEALALPTPARIREGYYSQPALRAVKGGSADESGFHNLFGNASEWTRTWYDDKRTFRSVRGGSIVDDGTLILPLSSWSRVPGETLGNVGFRVVLVENPSNTEAQASVFPIPEAGAVQVQAAEQKLQLSVKITSKPGVARYQWFKDGVPISGAEYGGIEVAAPTKKDSGYYVFKLNGVTLAAWNVSVIEKRIYRVSINGSDTSGDGSLAKPFASIQRAIDQGRPGDGILVYPGTYTQSLVIAKSLEIQSAEGPRKTIIRATGRGSAVFATGATVDKGRLVGFTLSGGVGFNFTGARDGYGGGFELAAPAGVTFEIQDCVISENNSSGITFGGGFHVTWGGTLLMNNSLVHGNAAWASGGAALVEQSNLVADRCTFVSNTSNGFNRIGGISAAGNCDIKIKNSILWGNSSNQYGSFSSGPSGTGNFYFSYSILQGGTAGSTGGSTKTVVVAGTGNLSVDPKFADTVTYKLGSGSPGIDAGDPTSANDSDGTRADIGFSEPRVLPKN
jgi:formylglycine-generating enzyme required for sulfatase activity